MRATVAAEPACHAAASLAVLLAERFLLAVRVGTGRRAPAAIECGWCRGNVSRAGCSTRPSSAHVRTRHGLVQRRRPAWAACGRWASAVAMRNRVGAGVGQRAPVRARIAAN